MTETTLDVWYVVFYRTCPTTIVWTPEQAVDMISWLCEEKPEQYKEIDFSVVSVPMAAKPSDDEQSQAMMQIGNMLTLTDQLLRWSTPAWFKKEHPETGGTK